MIADKINTQLLIHSSDFCISKVKFNFTNSLNKPYKALWTSTLIDTNSSSWDLWCQINEFNVKNHRIKYKIIPKDNLKIFEINNEEDLNFLPKIYDPIFNKNVIDFNIIAKLFDGIHCINYILPQLYGWDCESTVWFNTNWIKSIERLGDKNCA